MSTTFKSRLSEVMHLAWQIVKMNGYSMSEALKMAWMNSRLTALMKTKIVRFYFRKVSGEVRETFGTLQEKLLPEQKECNRKPNNTVLAYFDTERSEWRLFKKANLIEIK